MKAPVIEFDFPLPRTHTGIHLANGRMGALVWGTDTIQITVAENGFWDRRGENLGIPPMTYAELRSALLGGKEQAVREAFARAPGNMCQLSGGTLELDFGEPPLRANLICSSGLLRLTLASGRTVSFVMDPETNLLRTLWSGDPPDLRLIPAWDQATQEMVAHGLEPPYRFVSDTELRILQSLPSDPGLTIRVLRDEDGLAIQSCIGGELAAPKAFSEVAERSALDWSHYWDRLPDLVYGDSSIQSALEYSLWKLHAMLHPKGVAATLQGPWMEAQRIPLWNNDYHFNINLQMVYQPCLDLGLYDHLKPLWRLLADWLPDMRIRGEKFFAVPGAIMLPHAVDDRGMPIGSYWQGSIDHVSTSWIAIMAWQAAEASLDRELALTVAMPYMEGTFEGFWAMLERVDDALCLPISVSPEFGEGAPGTWGKNASYALAALHRLVLELDRAALWLDRSPDPRWQEVSRKLPKYAGVIAPNGPYDDQARKAVQIGLWEGQDLTESHRHHSHLAGIYPFDVFNGHDVDVVEQSLRHWAKLGGGQWSAWGVIWAVCIMARSGWVDGARAWLRFLINASLNEGKSISAGGARGCFVSWGSPEHARIYRSEGDHEVMQLDANLGLISAVCEILAAEAAAQWGLG